MAGTRARRARCGRRRARMAAARARAPVRPHPRLPRARLRPWGVQRPACRPSSTWAASGPAPGESRGPAAPAAPAGPGACSGESGTRPGTRRVPARGSGRQPRGSRIGDVTSDRIAPGGLARIERRRIVSRWARTARGGVDCVALGSHYASRGWPALAPARPGIGLRCPKVGGVLVVAVGRLFRGGFEDVGCEGCGGGLLGRVLLVRGVVARASECVSRV